MRNDRTLNQSNPRWDGHERRHDAATVEAIEARLKEGHDRMNAFERQLEQNTKMTAEIHEWVGKGRGFFSVLGVIGSTIKWMAATTAACVLLWKLWWTKDDGTPPPGL